MIDLNKPGYQPVVLPEKHKRLIAQVASVTGSELQQVILYGGAIRDWLLNRPISDFDFMVDGNRAVVKPDALVNKLGKKGSSLHLDKKMKKSVNAVDNRVVIRLASDEGVKLDLTYNYDPVTPELVAHRSSIGLGAVAANLKQIYLHEAFVSDQSTQSITVRPERRDEPDAYYHYVKALSLANKYPNFAPVPFEEFKRVAESQKFKALHRPGY